MQNYTPIRMDKILNTGIPSADENAEHCTLLIREQNDTATFKNNLAFSFTFKYTTALCPSRASPSYLLKRKENLCSHECLQPFYS